MDPLFCYCEHICGCAHHVKLDWESHAGVMIYDQIKPVVFFFLFFFIVLGGAVISRFLNSASFLWSPPLCGALRGSWGGDTHAHDVFRVTDGIPTFSFLPRYYSFYIQVLYADVMHSCVFYHRMVISPLCVATLCSTVAWDSPQHAPRASETSEKSVNASDIF